MRRSALIVPDSFSAVSPHAGWYHGYKNLLRSRQHEAKVTEPPDQVADTAREWVELLASTALEYFMKDNGVLIGHGIGGLAVLKALERHKNKPIAAAVVVSTPMVEGVLPVGLKEAGEFSEGFDFDFEKIRTSAEAFRVFHAVDDPIVNIENGVSVVSHLGSRAVGVFPAVGGHFNHETANIGLMGLLPRFN